MIQETYVTQETGMLIPVSGISKYAYCKQIQKLNWRDVLGEIKRVEVIDTNEFRKHFQYICDAPTHAVLAKWLRDVHNILVIINYVTHDNYVPLGKVEYCAEINTIDDSINREWEDSSEDDIVTDYYDTYEEALEAGLQQALKLIKDEGRTSNP